MNERLMAEWALMHGARLFPLPVTPPEKIDNQCKLINSGSEVGLERYHPSPSGRITPQCVSTLRGLPPAPPGPPSPPKPPRAQHQQQHVPTMSAARIIHPGRSSSSSNQVHQTPFHHATGHVAHGPPGIPGR